jgi:hypothetical protein
MRARVKVPVFAYFAVVTPALLGLLFAADAAIGPREPMKLAAAAPAALARVQPKTDAIQILTVREQVPVPAAVLAALANTAEIRGTAPDTAKSGGASKKPTEATSRRKQVASATDLAPVVPAPAKRAAPAGERRKKPVQATSPSFYLASTSAFAPPAGPAKRSASGERRKTPAAAANAFAMAPFGPAPNQAAPRGKKKAQVVPATRGRYARSAPHSAVY